MMLQNATAEWERELDSYEWADASTGYRCLILRAHLGALAGYVMLPSEHPWCGKSVEDCAGVFDVHGGVTYANVIANAWGFGFDCSHICIGAGFDCSDICDVIPGFAWLAHPKATYKNFAFVKKETESLARQLAALA